MGFSEFDFPAPLTAPASGTNLLRTGLAWLTGQLKANASEAIVYARGYDSVECRATLGTKLLKLDDGMGGFRMEWTDLDFLIPAADLDFGDGPITPLRGDVVHLTISGGSDVQTFEVVPYGGTEAVWRWADPHQSMIRVHAKYIDTEPFLPVTSPPIFDTLDTVLSGKPDHDKLYFRIIRFGPTDYRIWYSAASTIADGAFLGIGYAISADGFSWVRPILNQVTFNGSTANNLQTAGIWSNVQPVDTIYDPNARSGQKFIQLLASEGVDGGLYLLGSPNDDGLSWTSLATIYGTQNPFRAACAIAKRSDGIGVAFAVFGQSSNLRSITSFTSNTTDLSGAWTQNPQGFCTGLLASTSTAQFYGMKIIPLGPRWYACVSRYNSATGVLWSELWVSMDFGQSFTYLRQFVPLGGPNDWNSTILVDVCPVEISPGDWRVYFTAGNEPHADYTYNAQLGIANVAFP